MTKSEVSCKQIDTMMVLHTYTITIAIPKANSLFSFTIQDVLFTLRGSHLKFRPGERSARKFKEKPLTAKDLEYE